MSFDELKLTYGDFNIAWTDLPLASQLYCAQYGFRQSLVDAGALSAKARADKSEDEVAEMQREKRSARFNALIAGNPPEPGTRGAGEPVDPLARTMRQVAVERVVAALKAAGLAKPTAIDLPRKPVTINGTEYTGEALVARQMEKFAPAIEAEARKRLEAADATDAIAVDELI